MFLPATLTRLEKAAVDNGFDRELPPQADWIGFASSQAPLRIWLAPQQRDAIAVAFSQHNVSDALSELGAAISTTLPVGAVSARVVQDVPALHGLLRRAFQLSKALPDELLHVFEREVQALPRSTEAERLVVQRVGQDIFRSGLLDYWDGRCAVTGMAVPELLRASHIKPWAECEIDAERLDVFNGLLLAPQLDAVFDRGFLTFDDRGRGIVSPALTADTRRLLGIGIELQVRELADGHRRYLAWHREHVFRQAAS